MYVQFNTKEVKVFSPALVLNANLVASTEVVQNGKGQVTFHVDITAITGTSITFTFQGYDYAKGAWVTLLATAALTGTGHTVYNIGVDCPVTANVSACMVPPKRIRVLPSGSSLTSCNFSVTAVLR
jgi:hypothetical protein